MLTAPSIEVIFHPGSQPCIIEYPNRYHSHALSSLHSFSMGFNSAGRIGKSPIVTRDSGGCRDGEYAVEAWNNM